MVLVQPRAERAIRFSAAAVMELASAVRDMSFASSCGSWFSCWN